MTQTRIIKVERENFSLAQLQPAIDAIELGELVAFPTETVYGIAANAANADAVNRLSKLKSRKPSKPYTLHIGNLEQLRNTVGIISPIAKLLVKKYWPGPLTIIFPVRELPPDAEGMAGAARGRSTIGIRFPSDQVARAILSAARVPVIAPSANPADENPAVSGEEAAAYYEGVLPYIVDGGPSELGAPSTVVRAGMRKLDVLREGAIPAAELEALRIRTVIFVCTGNTCRSPMAEALFKMKLAERLGVEVGELEGLGYQVYSAGVAAFDGGRASEKAVQVMKERGYDLRGHISKMLTPVMVEEADLIVAMGHGHMEEVTHLSSRAADKVVLADPHGIADPVGQPLEVYRETAGRIERGVSKYVDKLLETE